MKKFVQYILLVFLLITAISSCETEKRYPPNGYLPVTPKATETLEAAYFWRPQDKLSSSYWKNAGYVEAELTDMSELNLYPDGLLNMTGTYRGLSSFNRGRDPKVTLKAGYDDTYLYLLVEWNDTTTNASYMTKLWLGPEDINKDDSTAGWTSQRNSDNVIVLFDNESNNTKNAWKWTLAYTAPFNMALNLKTDEDGNFLNETKPLIRNGNEENPRSAPLYEWNGTRQDIKLPDSSIKVLDPAYYLLDEYKTSFTGNIEQGAIVFNSTADCRFCHGPNGNGIPDGFTEGGLLADVFTNKYTREGLIEYIASSAHEGGGGLYYGKIKNDPVKVENLITFLRGIAGVPGNVLVKPQTIEIEALTNISLGGIEKRNSRYQVLFKRKLVTENTDDIDFYPGNTYNFSIRFSDNDEINFVGANNLQLVFKSNEL